MRKYVNLYIISAWRATRYRHPNSGILWPIAGTSLPLICQDSGHILGSTLIKIAAILVLHTVSTTVPIEEGLKQKTRQNVVVLDWGSRSNAALKILV